jgi:hypothetical protein
VGLIWSPQQTFVLAQYPLTMPAATAEWFVGCAMHRAPGRALMRTATVRRFRDLFHLDQFATQLAIAALARRRRRFPKHSVRRQFGVAFGRFRSPVGEPSNLVSMLVPVTATFSGQCDFVFAPWADPIIVTIENAPISGRLIAAANARRPPPFRLAHHRSRSFARGLIR